MRALLVLVVVVVAPLSARADDGVGVIVTGDHKLQPQVANHIEHWLQRHGHAVAKRALSDDARTTLVNCMTVDDPVCARGVVEARSASDAVVFARADVAPSGGNVTFTTYWFIKGHEPIGDHGVCERCGANQWQATVDRSLATIHKAADELTHTVDREPLRIEPAPVNVEHAEGGSRVLPITLFGAGVAGLAASGWFFYWGSKGGPNEPYVYPDATGWAIGSAAIGAGAILGGVVLWRSTRSAPVATLGAHHGYFGWITRF
jgi:hypothetical protein